jgi:hypothetical protein
MILLLEGIPFWRFNSSLELLQGKEEAPYPRYRVNIVANGWVVQVVLASHLTGWNLRDTVRTMEIVIRVNDDLYYRAKEAFADLDSSVEAYVTSYLEEVKSEEARINAARSRMKELFNTTKGFGVGQKPSREQMHERRRLH